ncbi:hypothetical protein RRG08_037670 [Elysia crispata]|uniref:Uncharacterized protein n=1 Tax=Elysia crispata TaxID=231223 RepID=A0AAE1A926_9GAST|nr:hypothetical protein RRG08_037670 [Elysia crispata]
MRGQSKDIFVCFTKSATQVSFSSHDRDKRTETRSAGGAGGRAVCDSSCCFAALSKRGHAAVNHQVGETWM